MKSAQRETAVASRWFPAAPALGWAFQSRSPGQKRQGPLTRVRRGREALDCSAVQWSGNRGLNPTESVSPQTERRAEPPADVAAHGQRRRLRASEDERVALDGLGDGAGGQADEHAGKDLSLKDVGVLLGLSEATLRRRLKDDILPAAKIGGVWRVRRAESAARCEVRTTPNLTALALRGEASPLGG